MRTILGRIKYNLIRLLVAIYYLPALPKTILIAKGNTLREFNKSKQVVPCPVCTSVNSLEFKIVRVSARFFAMFDLRNCLDDYFKPGYLAEGIRHYAPLFFKIHWRKCQNCHNAYQNFPHTEASLYKYYERYMEDKTITLTRPGIEKIKSLPSKYFIKNVNFLPNSRILDAGAAIGISCKYFESLGHEAWGIEPSIERVKYAKETQGLKNFVHGFYAPDVFDENYFDGILSHHVLEHVLNPKAFLESFRKHLKTGGKLLLQIPALDEDYRATGQCNHLVAYSVEGMSKLLGMYDFKVIELVLLPKDRKKFKKEWLHDDKESNRWTIHGELPGSMSIIAESIKNVYPSTKDNLHFMKN